VKADKLKALVKRLRPYLPGIAVAVALPLLLGAAFHASFTRVPVGRLAVRQDNWGGGIDSRVYGPGLHFGVRGLVSWHLLEAGTHIEHFTRFREAGSGTAPIVIRSRDNNTVAVDVTVSYTIKPGEAHRLVERGLELDYATRARNATTSILRRELAKLESTDWFDANVRRTGVRALVPLLDAAFGEFHLTCRGMQIHGFSYPKEFEQKLQEKQITHQRGRLAKARTLVQEAQATVGVYRAQTDGLVAEERARKQGRLASERAELLLQTQRVRSETKTHTRTLRARVDAEFAADLAGADLELEQVEAAAHRQHLEALSSPGGRWYLAQRAAQKLNVKSVLLNSTDAGVPNFLDLDQVVALLVGQGPPD